MTASEDRLRVFYDGACPSCVRDRKFYERLAGRTGDAVEWVDITGRDEELKQLGIDPVAALQELHVEDGRGNIHRELDATGLADWLTGDSPGTRKALSPLGG